MPYVPPHLRNGAGAAAAAASAPIHYASRTMDSGLSRTLDGSRDGFYGTGKSSGNTTGSRDYGSNFGNSNRRGANGHEDGNNAGFSQRRPEARGLSVPDSVSPIWQPSERVRRLQDEQVKAFSRSLGAFRTAIVVGGTNIAEQRSELRSGVEIVVATPGRFIDHLQQGNSSLSRISFVVLDEADRMLDMGFEPQIRETRCDEVTDALVAQGLRAVALHGGRSQGEREAALRDFRSGSTNILVATDVASRGLDVTGVAHVVNLDLPKAMEDYVHRIGRTGRAGTTGRATSFYTDRDMPVTLSTNIRVEDKYKYMLAQANLKQEGAADNAWDD